MCIVVANILDLDCYGSDHGKLEMSRAVHKRPDTHSAACLSCYNTLL